MLSVEMVDIGRLVVGGCREWPVSKKEDLGAVGRASLSHGAEEASVMLLPALVLLDALNAIANLQEFWHRLVRMTPAPRPSP
jgi:hypothetical protein